ncbi:MAG TPA: hypothetical protein VFR94_14540 [Nitrososphaeraceae archaeon]|nr:hypothetical protein [Nitrososphaeraceae archaeon]
MMKRTGLRRSTKENKTGKEYIDLVVTRQRRPAVRQTAVKMYDYLASVARFSGRPPSMLAMVSVNLAAIEKNQIFL